MTDRCLRKFHLFSGHRYSEYKKEFKRQQLNEFFVTHKGEEWFKQKYHPVESKERRDEQKSSIKRRQEIFFKLLDSGRIDGVNVDHDNEEKIVKLLNEVVVRLEKEDVKLKGQEEQKIVKQEKKEEKEEVKDMLTDEEKDNGEEAKTAELKTEPDKGEAQVEDGGEELYKTTSIFLRTLAPGVTKQEVEALCKRYPGFLRVCIADPAPDKKWVRRGWVTFRRDVKIKEICFALNNVRLKNMELCPVVNKDLSKRVRTVPGMVQDKKIVRSDIQLAAKIIANLDGEWELWQERIKNGESGLQDSGGHDAGAAPSNSMFVAASNNPLLSNITDYLIEEEGAEEAELLGNKECEDSSKGQEGVDVTRDEELVKVLDRLLLYLRIVHSVDFYNHADYANEDEMPNRLGIVHARGPAPDNKVTADLMDDYSKGFEKQLSSFLAPKVVLTDEEAVGLGLKNQEDEVEKFILANTQEMGKDKWLCPLSGKKFKGPEFVKKHIFNKHHERVEKVKTEVTFFNSYLKDPKRPELPENPRNKPPAHRPAAQGVKRALEAPGSDGREPRRAPPRQDDRVRPTNQQPRRTGVHARLGHNTMKVTQSTKDPRQIVDYSDVDFLGGDVF